MGIPQYNALEDKTCASYFQRKGLPKSVKNVKEGGGKMSSMMGGVFDRFLRSTEAREYLHDRQKIGGGYTRKLYGGHLSVPTSPPKVGYHGEEGYRRNTPDLRNKRSVFDYEGNPKGPGSYYVYSIDSVVMRKHTRLSFYPFVCRPIRCSQSHLSSAENTVCTS